MTDDEANRYEMGLEERRNMLELRNWDKTSSMVRTAYASVNAEMSEILDRHECRGLGLEIIIVQLKLINELVLELHGK